MGPLDGEAGPAEVDAQYLRAQRPGDKRRQQVRRWRCEGDRGV